MLSHDASDETAAGPEAPSTSCWGAIAAGLEGSSCSSDFTPGKGHFKNKFCAHCREFGINVPAWCVRALTEDQKTRYQSNSLSAGFWKVAPPSLGGGEFRLVCDSHLTPRTRAPH